MAYDVKKLVEKLKARGMNLAEDGAKGAAEDVIAWVMEEAKASPSPFDDVVALVLGQLKGDIMKELDKIDGSAG